MKQKSTFASLVIGATACGLIMATFFGSITALWYVVHAPGSPLHNSTPVAAHHNLPTYVSPSDSRSLSTTPASGAMQESDS